MTTRVEAKALVDAFITNDDLPAGDVAIVLDDETIERPWGWVFFYNSRRFVETGDVRSCLGGNAPLIVERTSGRLLETGTAQDIGFYLSNYEATGDPYMQPGRVLELSCCDPGANRIEAARLIAKATTISIGAAKRGIDEVARGHSFKVDAGSVATASSLCEALRDAGFGATQLPEQTA